MVVLEPGTFAVAESWVADGSWTMNLIMPTTIRSSFSGMNLLFSNSYNSVEPATVDSVPVRWQSAACFVYNNYSRHCCLFASQRRGQRLYYRSFYFTLSLR